MFCFILFCFSMYFMHVVWFISESLIVFVVVFCYYFLLFVCYCYWLFLQLQIKCVPYIHQIQYKSRDIVYLLFIVCFSFSHFFNFLFYFFFFNFPYHLRFINKKYISFLLFFQSDSNVAVKFSSFNVFFFFVFVLFYKS